jgi:hypothetical protein
MLSLILLFIVILILGFVHSDKRQEKQNKDFQRWKDANAKIIKERGFGDIIIQDGRMWMVVGKTVNGKDELTGLYCNEMRLGAKVPEGFLITQSNSFQTFSDFREVPPPYYWKD